MTGVTAYTQEMASRICLQMSEGRSLRSICREADMPVISTVMKWLREQPTFSEQYAQARDDRADAMFEDMITIADDLLEVEQVTIRETEKGIQRDTKSGDGVERARLMVQTRQWALARMAPKKFGDRVLVDAKVDTLANWREDEKSILERHARQYSEDQKPATNRKRTDNGKGTE